MAAYEKALKTLDNLDLTYACNCTRSDIKEAQPLPIYGPDGLVYPGTCRDKNLPLTKDTAIRLNMAKAIEHLGGASQVNQMKFIDIDCGVVDHYLDADKLLNNCGDFVLARRDIGTSYHLAVVVDDSAQEITHVTRGLDLFDATQIHRVLQALLGLPTPIYHHHRLILDENGKRLAKRDDSRAIRKYREDGATPQDIREMVSLGNR